MRQLGIRRLFVPGLRKDKSTEETTSPAEKRNRRTNRLFIMPKSSFKDGTVSELCRVFSRDSSDNTASLQTAPPDVSWDESSSSNWTTPRPCLKVLSQKESLQYSYYDCGGFEPLSYRVDFSMQTVYYHDLTVQELRGPNDEKEMSVKPYSISLQEDPWTVVVSNVSTEIESTSCKERRRKINRWGRATRERVWNQFCQQSKLEEQQRLYKELRLAEEELNDITAVPVDQEQYEEQHRELEQTLDAMEMMVEG